MVRTFWIAAIAVPTMLGAQSAPSGTANGSSRAPSVTHAVRASVAPVIDGRGRDVVWESAPAVTDFRVFDPVHDGDPSMRTEARFAFDERNFYVLVRAFDPHPDSIMALLSRRDERTQSDYIRVILDTYHDKRTAYTFMVNPAGVQRDIYVFNDSEEDVTWNAVWEAKTTIDSLGWVAEFRIPLSQVRFGEKDDHTFGVSVSREIGRSNERSAWPLFRRDAFGIVSQLGEVSGIAGIGKNRRLEVLPYTVQSNESKYRRDRYGRLSRGTVGGDVKVGISSNLTLDATINPDFGQVEADPAVLNLSAFEQFFGERRPFFLEGTGIFSFAIDCNDGQCTGPFYSRRIGRPPQAGFLAAAGATVPRSSTILGAAKLTGRLSNGLSLGIMNAVTARESINDSLTVEPRSNYFVARLQQDLRGGRSGVGLVFSAVNRDLDEDVRGLLRREAYVAGLDWRHRFGPGGNLNWSGHALGSTVRGSAEAIARTQQSSVHFYQRPDDDIEYDPTRTSLSGASIRTSLNKQAGGITRFSTGIGLKTPGVEINDVGFMQNANLLTQSNWFALQFQQPRAFYRRAQINFNQYNSWFTDGTNTGHGGNINANAQFNNMWNAYAGVGGELGSICGSCTRGGPGIYEQPRIFSFAGFSADQRKAIVPGFNIHLGRGDNGRSKQVNLGPEVDFRVASSFSASLGMNFDRNIDDRQPIDNFGVSGNDTTHYTMAHLDQRTFSLSTRINWTASPTMSFQFYGEPFVTAGKFSNWREVARPRDTDYDRLYQPFTLYSNVSAYDFNYKQFRSNSVFRWEYRPGSTLFVVWQQGRTQDRTDVGSFSLDRDYRNLFRAHPENTFLIKSTYWFSF